MKNVNWPNFFIVGAMRAGTTSLYNYLGQIPEIYMPKIKEPHFFAPGIPEYYMRIKNEKKYLKLFENVKNELLIGEASVSYLWWPKTPMLIKEKIPNAKLIAMLRNPVERSYSHYFMEIGLGIQTQSFHELVLKLKYNEFEILPEFIEHSLYSNKISKYLETFGTKQLKIIIFEEFIKNPIATINDVLKFLGISKEYFDLKPTATNPTHVMKNEFVKNIGNNLLIRKIVQKILPDNEIKSFKKLFLKEIKKPRIEKSDKELLTEFFREDVQKLESILEKKLPWFT